MGLLVEFMGLEESPSYTPVIEGELQLSSSHFYEDLKVDISMKLQSPLVLPSSKSPTQPPSPASSSKASQSFGPTSAGSLKLLVSSFVCSIVLHGYALDLPVTSSTSACQPASTTLPPPSLGSTWGHHPYGSTGLLRLSGFALVRR